MPEAIETVIEKGDPVALAALLRADPGLVRWRNEKEKTALHLAASAGHAPLVKALLAAGAAPEAGDAYDYPPINQAAWSGHREVIALLVEFLDPNSPAAAALLTMLAGRGHLVCVELVLARGVPVDVDDGLGQTALIHALRKGHGAVARLLLEKGARVDLTVGALQETPLSLARASKLDDIVALIEARGGAKAAPAPKKEEEAPLPELGSAAERLPGAVPLTLAKVKQLLRGVQAFKGGLGSRRLYLLEGNQRVRGDLVLDADEVLVVTGSLVVDGALIDALFNEDDHSELYVLGELRARTLLTGSPVYVRGDLTVRETLYGNSFGLDSLVVTGKLRAGVLIDEGHEFDCGQIEAGRILVSEGQRDTWRDFPEATPLSAGVFASPTLYRRGFVDPGVLVQRARDGAPIVKPGPAPAPRRKRT